jgi:hypothetical protein
LVDLQGYAGERIAALCAKTALSQWEDVGNYVLIHIRAEDTKVRHIHACIIPKGLADRIRAYAHQLGRQTPFPNHETLWREITKLALAKFGIRLTSHYLRKRFYTIAGKSGIPVNSADYLMGDKATWGHAADTYTLQDFGDLIREYDRFLAPYLSLTALKEPDDPREPFKNEQLEQLLKENQELKEQILKLLKLLTEKLQNP